MKIKMLENMYNILPTDIKRVADGLDIEICVKNSELNFTTLWNMIINNLQTYLNRQQYFSSSGYYYCGIKWEELLKCCKESIEVSLLSYFQSKELKILSKDDFLTNVFNCINNTDELTDKKNHLDTILSNMKELSEKYNSYNPQLKKIQNTNEIPIIGSPLVECLILEHYNDIRNKPVNKMNQSKYAEHFISDIQSIINQNVTMDNNYYYLYSNNKTDNKLIHTIIDALEYEELCRPYFNMELYKFYLNYKDSAKTDYNEKKFLDILTVLSKLQELPNILFSTDFVSKIADHAIMYDSDESYKRVSAFTFYISYFVYPTLEIIYGKAIYDILLNDEQAKSQLTNEIIENSDIIDRILGGLYSVEDFFKCSIADDIMQYSKIPLEIDDNIRMQLYHNFYITTKYMFSFSHNYEFLKDFFSNPSGDYVNFLQEISLLIDFNTWRKIRLGIIIPEIPPKTFVI